MKKGTNFFYCFFFGLLFVLWHKPVDATVFYLDQYFRLKNQFVIHFEQPISSNDAGILEYQSVTDSLDGIDYHSQLYGVAYRRFHSLNNDTAVLYSFGFRFGRMKINQESIHELHTVYVPYYDVGLKSKLSKKLFSVVRLEIRYLIAYTDDIDIDDILGLQVTPYFSIGYLF